LVLVALVAAALLLAMPGRADAAGPPTAVTEAASSVTQSSATLNATVNPNGGNVTDCHFDYGPTASYGSSAPCASLPGSGESAVAVSASVTGLTANATYHFKIVATNGSGTAEGLDLTFKTPPNVPTAVTEAASSVTQSSATLNATVNPNGGEVSDCKLEYGITTAYGSSTPCTPSPGTGTTPVAGSASIAGLAPNTTVPFRIVATNGSGTSKGSDHTFSTPPEAPTVVTKKNEPPPTVVPPSPVVLPPPLLTRSGNVFYVTGAVNLRLPGTHTFLPLRAGLQIPYLTVVDATHGEVSIATATGKGGIQTGQFFDGQFVVTQGRDGTVLAALTGGNFSVCRRARSGRWNSWGKHLVRRLWATASGSFTTKGRYATAAARGAQWLTEDACEATLILATRNRVQVTDLVRHRRINLLAGQIYIAKAR
jgi:hypothetical protein